MLTLTQVDDEIDAVEAMLPPVASGQALAPVVEQAVAVSDPRAALLTLAVNKDLDVDKLKALIDMQDRMEDRQAVRLFNTAFVRMQARLPAIKRNGALEYPVDKNKPDGPKRLVSRYATWDDIDAAIQPILHTYGFALSFRIAPRLTEGGGLLVAAVLRHVDGHVDTGEPIPVPLDTSGGKNNVQAYGSALSYGKRYATIAALKIRTEGDDDDGKQAGVVYLTDEQVAQLSALVDETETDPAAFFATMITEPIESFTDIERTHFERLMNALMSKKRQKERRVQK